MSIQTKLIILSLGLVLIFTLFFFFASQAIWLLHLSELLFLVLFFFGLYAWIIEPIRQIWKSLRENQLDPIQKLINRSDEFGQVARLIQHLFLEHRILDAEVTRRVEIETTLRSSETAYRSLIDHSIQGLAILAHGRIVFSNLALATGLGYSVEELVAMSRDQVSALIHPADQPLVHQCIDECLGIGADKHFEVRMIGKNNVLTWMEIYANRIEYQEERAVQLAYLDITNRKNTEGALIQEQAFVLTILNMVNSLVIVLDPSGRIIRGNPACERITDHAFAEMKDKYFWDIFCITEETERFKSSFLHIINNHTETYLESSFKRSGGQRCWITWSNAFLTDPDNQLRYVVCTGMEITELKQRERQQAAITVLSSELRGHLSRKRTFQIIIEQISTFLQADLVALAMMHPETGQLVIEMGLGQDADNLFGRSIPAGEEIADNDILGGVLRTRQPYLNSEQAESLGSIHPTLTEKFYTSWVPLVAEGNLLGLLMIARKEPIDGMDFNLLAAITDIATSSIHRCLLSEETQRRLQRLSALYTINIAVGASLDIRVTLNVLVNQITTQLGVDAADILLIDPVTRELYFVAGHGFRSQVYEKVRHWLGQGQAGQVALKRRSVHLYDPKGIAGLFMPDRSIEMEDFIAYNAVPLFIKGEVRGVLETFHRAPYGPEVDWLEFLEALATETSIAINNADLLEKLQRSNMDLVMAYDATIEGWAQALEMRDQVTEDHTRRVAEVTVHLAQALGVRGDELKYMRYGALLHDIGKMGIPDAILNKPGPLTEEEWVIMRKHPELSLKMLSSIPFLNSAISIPYCHHERWDGSGYPQRLVGRQIPLAARIFAVVDVWDALHSKRVYHEAIDEDAALNYLQQNAGLLFDPEVVAAFVEMFKYKGNNGG